MRSDINRKLCTYNHFKQKYHSEPYLNYITDPSTRKEVTRFRISAHSLRIETGRYKKLDRDKRICLMCNSGDVEDEFHFIIKCQAYLDIRNKYLQPILEGLQYLQNEWDMFINIMKFDDENVTIKCAWYIQQDVENKIVKGIKYYDYNMYITCLSYMCLYFVLILLIDYIII